MVPLAYVPDDLYTPGVIGMNWSQIILVKQQVYSVRLSTMKAFNRIIITQFTL